MSVYVAAPVSAAPPIPADLAAGRQLRPCITGGIVTGTMATATTGHIAITATVTIVRIAMATPSPGEAARGSFVFVMLNTIH